MTPDMIISDMQSRPIADVAESCHASGLAIDDFAKLAKVAGADVNAARMAFASVAWSAARAKAAAGAPLNNGRFDAKPRGYSPRRASATDLEKSLPAAEREELERELRAAKAEGHSVRDVVRNGWPGRVGRKEFAELAAAAGFNRHTADVAFRDAPHVSPPKPPRKRRAPKPREPIAELVAELRENGLHATAQNERWHKTRPCDFILSAVAAGLSASRARRVFQAAREGRVIKPPKPRAPKPPKPPKLAPEPKPELVADFASGARLCEVARRWLTIDREQFRASAKAAGVARNRALRRYDKQRERMGLNK
ncbi:hypothetical protein [Sphingomonas sp.]|uniref:hypothetical protein n=1 Tax=Sphingomonas sp. TaxID=28214 RepID=UPI002DD61BA2|nr:hypothetical protein [Sphingomonas sp.]